MHGLSGSGKTTVSQALIERLGAVRLRSDVERKRLHGLDATARSGAGLDAGIYAAAASRRTYEHLAQLAAAVLEAGYPALVDAALLQRAQRDLLRRVAERHAVPALIVACAAPLSTLRRRVRLREAASADASEAGAAVLEHQLAAAQPLAQDELATAVSVDTGGEASMRAGLDAVAARLAAGEGAHAPH
jgi:predicted kinase